MADQEANIYPVRLSEEAENSNSQFPDPADQLPEEDVSILQFFSFQVI